MDDKDWAELWEEFAWKSETNIDDEFQTEMCAKHGSGHYYMDADESWNRQKDLIQKLVNAKLNAKLKEKNLVKEVARQCAEIADKAEPYKSADLIRKHFRVEE